MKVDLHMHTQERSACGDVPEDVQIRAAIDAGLDGIALTDHRRLPPEKHLDTLRALYAPLRIFCGIEMTVDDEDIVVLGVYDTALEKDDWNYRDLYDFVTPRGGVLILAHPFRYRPTVRIPVELYPPHAVEIYSCNIAPENADRIAAFAHSIQRPCVSNSDAHGPHVIGHYYTQLDYAVQTDEELCDILHTGAFTAVAHAPNKPRCEAPRITPPHTSYPEHSSRSHEKLV